MKTLYKTSVNILGGRNGSAKSEDGLLNVELRRPKEMGGEGGATNPEQLFAAGYAACFDSALNHIARQQNLKIGRTEIVSHVSLLQNEKDEFELAVKMQVKIPNVEKAVAEQLLDEAHRMCPYSRAVKGNIEVQLELV